MAAGVACGLQNRYGARTASRVGSTPTRSRHSLPDAPPGPSPGRRLDVGLRRLVLPLLLCVAAIPGGLAGQEPSSPDTVRLDPAVSPDSAVARPTPVVDSAGSSLARPAAALPDSTTRPVSAMGAFWRSLVLPGWGQAKVGQPGRGAFYFTMEAASLWMVFKTSQKKSAAERAGDEDLAAVRGEQQEDWIVLSVFWALFAGIDAWVSAHMWDFEGAVVPPPDGSPGVAVQYSVPVDVP